MNTNYNYIIKYLKDFVDANVYLKYFKFSFEDQRDVDLTNTNKFPALYATLENITYNEQVKNYNLNLYFLDMLNPNRSNEVDIMNNLDEVIDHFHNYIDNDKIGYVESRGVANPLNNFTDNRMNGYNLSVTISFKREQCYKGDNI